MNLSPEEGDFCSVGVPSLSFGPQRMTQLAATLQLNPPLPSDSHRGIPGMNPILNTVRGTYKCPFR